MSSLTQNKKKVVAVGGPREHLLNLIDGKILLKIAVKTKLLLLELRGK